MVDYLRRTMTDNGKRLAVIFIALNLLVPLCNGKLFQLEVLERAPVCEVEDRFLSFAMGMDNARNDFSKIDYSSQKLKTLLTALKPAYMRVGGSASNFLFFKVGSTKPSTPPTFPNQIDSINSQVQSSQPTSIPSTVALPTSNPVSTLNPSISNSSPAPTVPSNSGTPKPTAFTPKIPDKPTIQQGNGMNPPGQGMPTGNEQNQGNMDQNQNPNQNQDQGQNQVGQGQPTMQPTVAGPPNPKKPNKERNSKPFQPELPAASSDYEEEKESENPGDALTEYHDTEEDGIEVKDKVISNDVSSGSGETFASGGDYQGSGEETEGSGIQKPKRIRRMYRRYVENTAKVLQPFWLMSDDFDKLHNFLKDAGTDMIFNIGDFVRYSNGSWNATNALEMLHHVAYRGYKIGWQLGNDPNRYKKYGPNRAINATQAGNDSVELRKILRSNDQFGTLLVGPDITLLQKSGSAERYLQKYLKTNASSELSAIAWHQYCVNGRTTSEKEMVSPSTLDVFKDQVKRIKSIMKEAKTEKPLWLTETGSATKGGAIGLSDTFAASFMYLDKLGVAGVFCNSVVMRQSFVKGNYAMLDDDYSPRPDYWLALLHKRLVGKRVLLVSGDSKSLRAYAHCTRKSTVYQPGSVTVFVLNLREKPARIEFGNALKDKRVDQFLVTSADGTLSTKTIMLNGEKLVMRSNTTMPNLPALGVEQPMKMPSYSYAFYVIPDAGIDHCK